MLTKFELLNMAAQNIHEVSTIVFTVMSHFADPVNGNVG